jgi:hypothetical protein
MKKIVINTDFGDFGLSEVAEFRYKNESGNDLLQHEIPRDDPILVSIVEELGSDSWGEFASLSVVEIPDGVEWVIHNYDGAECIQVNPPNLYTNFN